MLARGKSQRTPYLSNNIPAGDPNRQSMKPNMEMIHDTSLSEKSWSWCFRQYVWNSPMLLSSP